MLITHSTAATSWAGELSGQLVATTSRPFAISNGISFDPHPALANAPWTRTMVGRYSDMGSPGLVEAVAAEVLSSEPCYTGKAVPVSPAQ